MQLERDSLYAGFTKKADQQTLPAEIANRNRFAIAQAWLKPLIGFVREGFKGYSPTVEGFVAAKSFLLRNAIEGEYPDYIINPAKMKLSYGDLPMAADPAVAHQADTNELVFTRDQSTPAGASNQDQVMLLAYFASVSKVISMTTGVFRRTGTDELQLSDNLLGKEADVYIAFIAADRSRQSDSVYLGKVLCE